ncbi:ATP-dependent Clp protease protease subunit [Bradyrhizobium embrapense]
MPITYINVHAQINNMTVQNLMAACAAKLAQGTTEFYFLLSTPGGAVMSGLTLYNFLRAIPAKVTMHNTGNVDSIGNAIFLAADKENRFACPHSTFMFHGVGADVAGGMRIEEKNGREMLDSILADQARIGSILVERTALTKNQAGQLFRKASTKDAADALSVGLVADIRDLVIPQGAEILSLVL